MNLRWPMIPSWQKGDMAARGWHGGWSGKLRAYIFKSKQEAGRAIWKGWDYELSHPTPSDTLPPPRLHFPKQWQCHPLGTKCSSTEPRRDILNQTTIAALLVVTRGELNILWLSLPVKVSLKPWAYVGRSTAVSTELGRQHSMWPCNLKTEPLLLSHPMPAPWWPIIFLWWSLPGPNSLKACLL